MAQYANLTTPDPEWVAMREHIPIAKPAVSVQAYRADVEAFRAMIMKEKGPMEGLKVIEQNFQIDNGEMLRARVYIPEIQKNEEAQASGFPLILWIYGGGGTTQYLTQVIKLLMPENLGFINGSMDNEDAMLRNLAISSRIVCVTADYRKAPECPFPAAVNDSYAALKWALNHSSEFSVDVSRGVLVAGLSSGGNLAAVVAQKSVKDSELKGKITGQVLIMPVVIMPGTYPERFKSELLSVDKDEDQRVLKKDQYVMNCDAYRGDADVTNPELSPLLADSFEGLPPAYIQIAGLDLLKDEGLLYHRLLTEAGVPTRLDTYPGFPHGFHVIFNNFDATKIQQADLGNGLNWLLHRTA